MVYGNEGAPPLQRGKGNTRQKYRSVRGRPADAEQHRWLGRQRRGPRIMVRGARRTETAFGRFCSRTAITAVEAWKEMPPWQTLDLAKEHDKIGKSLSIPSFPACACLSLSLTNCQFVEASCLAKRLR